VPNAEPGNRNGVAVADPGTAAETEGAAAEPRADGEPPAGHLSGSKSRFDEIVTPHPVVAFLFRRRTFIVLLGMLAMVPWAQPKPALMAAGIGLMLLAEALRIWAAGTIHKTEELTTGGPYAFVRHPLYVGSFVHTVAYCLMSGHWQSFLFAVPLFLLLYSAAVSTEEAMLHKLYGRCYEEYSRQVPRFIPRLRRPERGHGRFSWAQVAENKEYVNIIWAVLLCSLFLLRAR
jgi:protein-S-isoprenylcysteine O-methyltransferase Ste14